MGRFSIGRAVTNSAASCHHQIERLEKRFYHNVEPIHAYAVAGLHRQPVKQGAQQSLERDLVDMAASSPACFACCSRWMIHWVLALRCSDSQAPRAAFSGAQFVAVETTMVASPIDGVERESRPKHIPQHGPNVLLLAQGAVGETASRDDAASGHQIGHRRALISRAPKK